MYKFISLLTQLKYQEVGFQSKYLLSSLYYKTGTIRCLGLHFSDRTVRLIEISLKKVKPVRLIETVR